METCFFFVFFFSFVEELIFPFFTWANLKKLEHNSFFLRLKTNSYNPETPSEPLFSFLCSSSFLTFFQAGFLTITPRQNFFLTFTLAFLVSENGSGKCKSLRVPVALKSRRFRCDFVPPRCLVGPFQVPTTIQFFFSRLLFPTFSIQCWRTSYLVS